MASAVRRREYMEAQFTKEWLIAERYDAKTEENCSLDDLVNKGLFTFKSKATEALPLGSILCSASHMSVWRTIVESNEDIENVLIFEDDARLIGNFFEKINIAIDHLPKDYDIAYFDYLKFYGDKINEYFGKPKEPAPDDTNVWFSCYMLSRVGAAKLLKLVIPLGEEDNCRSFDLDDKVKKNFSKINAYFSLERLAFQNRIVFRSDRKKINDESGYNHNHKTIRLLAETQDYSETLKLAPEGGAYTKPVIFHCYWNGDLSEKHLLSIKSFYFFNVYQEKHKNKKIILWLQNNTPNYYNHKINEFAEIKQFIEQEEAKDTFLENYEYKDKAKDIEFFADYVRSLLLYKYGGCWFDLDCFALRNFSTLFSVYGENICLYHWGRNFRMPNNAIYISLQPYSRAMEKNMMVIIRYGHGWGFKQIAEALRKVERFKISKNKWTQHFFELPLDLLVLPTSWFDPDWIPNPINLGFKNFLKTTDTEITFKTFYPGAFCYHWHNLWDAPIEDNSPIRRLSDIIDLRLMV